MTGFRISRRLVHNTRKAGAERRKSFGSFSIAGGVGIGLHEIPVFVPIPIFLFIAADHYNDAQTRPGAAHRELMKDDMPYQYPSIDRRLLIRYGEVK
jgi:hypothetical protein